MVTGVFFCLLKYLICFFFLAQIKYFFKTTNLICKALGLVYRIHKNTHDFSFLKENKTRDFSPKK